MCKDRGGGKRGIDLADASEGYTDTGRHRVSGQFGLQRNNEINHGQDLGIFRLTPAKYAGVFKRKLPTGYVANGVLCYFGKVSNPI